MNKPIRRLPRSSYATSEWPRTDEIKQSLPIRSNGYGWPCISIVTPSKNQGQFIEETIRSVLLQGYPNLEYIIIDGGSTDNSTEVITKYEAELESWVSEPDNGQADAINKGFERATGSLLGWVNSDDLLVPGSLEFLAETHRQNPDSILAGSVIDFDEAGDRLITHQQGLILRNIVKFWEGKYRYHMPGIFYPRDVALRTGPLDENLDYLFDMDFLCRILQLAPVVYIDEPIARFRLHEDSKTVTSGFQFLPEAVKISKRYLPLLDDVTQNEFNRGVSERYAGVSLVALIAGDIETAKEFGKRSLAYDRLGFLRHLVLRIRRFPRFISLTLKKQEGLPTNPSH